MKQTKYPLVFQDEKGKLYTKYKGENRFWDAYHSALSFKKRKGKVAKEKNIEKILIYFFFPVFFFFKEKAVSQKKFELLIK